MKLDSISALDFLMGQEIKPRSEIPAVQRGRSHSLRHRHVAFWPEASVGSTSPPRKLLKGNLPTAAD
jgi:hypothetical protein